jgi:hypothetical protein
MRSEIKTAAIWLYIVAAATMLNSVLVQLFSHFVDLLAGLWFTQASDALWVGMRSVEPPGVFPSFEIGAALVIDVLVAALLVKLARKISRGSRRATLISFFLYLADTVAFGLSFRVSVRARVAVNFLAWQALTIMVHIAGIVILYRALRSLRGKSRPLAPVESVS